MRTQQRTHVAVPGGGDYLISLAYINAPAACSVLQAVQAAAAAAARSAEAEREMLQATSNQLQDEMRARAAAMVGLVAARDDAAWGLAEAKQQLEAEQAAAAAAKAAAAALERRLGELTMQVGLRALLQCVHAVQITAILHVH